MASKNIKGITIEIGGDTTALDKALKNSEKSVKSIQSELREVEKALKLDPGNITLLEQKHELLGKAVQEAADKLKLLKDAQKDVQKQYESGKITGEQYRAFQREVVNAENSLKNFESELDSSGKALEEERNSADAGTQAMKKLKEGVEAAEKSMSGIKHELGEVEKALKLDPGNITLLEQKHELLGKAVQEAADKLKLLKDAQKDVQKQYESGKITGEQYRAFRREVVNAENSLKDLESELHDSDRALDTARNSADESSQAMKKLKESMESAESSMNGIQRELGEVEKALKLDPGNITLLKQKQELLSKAVEETTHKLFQLKDAQKDVQKQYESGKITGEQYRAFQREIVNTENALENLEGQLSETGREIRDSERNTNQSTSGWHQFKESVSHAKETISKVSDVLGNLKEKFQKVTETVKKFGEAAKTIAEVTLKSLSASLKAVSTEVETGMKAFSTYVTGLTNATTAIGKFAFKSGQDFETSMSKVQALSGATGKDFDALKNKAREMGASTSKSAAESADALGYMALAGWDTQQMLTGLEPILRASEAGEMDLATCSDLVTDSMSAMGVKVEELNGYLNVVSKTQASSNTSMQQMLEAYVGCGGTLKNLEVPLETSATLIGVLANRGIKGSEAGTALNSVLVNLMGASGKASDALDMLGVSMYENGKRRDINDMLRDLNQKLAECDEQSRDTFTAMIGGKTQMDTLQALLAGVSNEYDELNGKIKDCDGYLLDAAKTMQDNVKGSVTALKSALEGLGISIYYTFSEKLQETIGVVTGFVSRISSAVENGNIIAVLLNIRSEIINILLDSVSEIADRLREGTEIFNALIISVTDIALELLPKITDKILPELLKGMQKLVNSLAGRLPAFIPRVLNASVKLFSGLLEGMKQTATRVSSMLPMLTNQIVPALTAELPAMFRTGMDIITAIISGITGAVPNIIPAAVICISSFISVMITTISENLPLILQSGVELLMAILSGIAESLPSLVETMQACILSVIQIIIDNLPEFLNTGITILLTLIDGIIDMLPELISAAVDLVLTIVDTILGNLDKVIGAALKVIMAVCEGILDNLDKIFDAAYKVVKEIVKAIINNLDKIIEAAIMILVTIGSTLVSSAHKLLEFIPKLGDKIREAFKEINWGEVGEHIMSSIFDGITRIGEKAKDMLGSVGDKIIDALGFHADGTFSLPFFANGGVLTSGSAIVGEAGPELLSVANGRAVVTPLTESHHSSTLNSPTYNITNIVKVDKISNDYDIVRINQQLAAEQKKQLSAIGG